MKRSVAVATFIVSMVVVLLVVIWSGLRIGGDFGNKPSRAALRSADNAADELPSAESAIIYVRDKLLPPDMPISSTVAIRMTYRRFMGFSGSSFTSADPTEDAQIDRQHVWVVMFSTPRRIRASDLGPFGSGLDASVDDPEVTAEVVIPTDPPRDYADAEGMTNAYFVLSAATAEFMRVGVLPGQGALRERFDQLWTMPTSTPE